MRRKMLLVFSGTDGAGKSTQINLLQKYHFADQQRVICIWARGGYTPGFEAIKKLVRIMLGRRLPPSGNNSSRAQSLSRPHIARLWLSIAIIDLFFYWGIYLRFQRLLGRVVICDRYIDDTRLDFKRNFTNIIFEKSLLWKMLEWTVPKPDASFLLWVPVEVSIKRSLEKNEPFPDDEDTLRWRLQSYMDESLFPSNRYVRIDCQQDVETISSQITSHLSTLIQVR